AAVVAVVRARCRVAMLGNHDYGVTGTVSPERFGPPGSLGRRSLALAAADLEASGDLLDWMRSRRPAARRHGIQCWHGSPRDAVREYVGKANAAACLERQRERLGLVGHTHEAAAWHALPGGPGARVPGAPGTAVDLSEGKWLLNPGAVGAPFPVRGHWYAALEAHGRDGAWWIELDLDPDAPPRRATWRRAPFDPAPTRERARALGLDTSGHD